MVVHDVALELYKKLRHVEFGLLQKVELWDQIEKFMMQDEVIKSSDTRSWIFLR